MPPNVFDQLEMLLGIKINHPKLFLQAFTIRSYWNEHPSVRVENNQRLEHLGDAVLELIVTEHLFRTLPADAEGDLTRLRVELVRTETLAEVAEQLGLHRFIRASRGLMESIRKNQKVQPRILANIFEAVLAAIYLDCGRAEAEAFVKKTVIARLAQVAVLGTSDWKNKVQELLHARGYQSPVYQLLRQSGPAHYPTITVGMLIEGTPVVEMQGASKREAENACAKRALEMLTSISDPIFP